MKNTSFAISYTVKNEARLLASAVDYHLASGCSKIYIFFDGTTDNTKELIRVDERISFFETTMPTELKELPSWIVNILPWWITDMDVRKRINTYYATKMAYEAGIEWLACIDPDELIAPYLNQSISSTLTPNFLSKIEDKYDQILLRNLEFVPTTSETQNPFKEDALFLNRFPVTETIWRYSSALVKRLVRSPRINAWYEYLFYIIRFNNALPRLMKNPKTGDKIPASYFLGYSNHKSFIRTKCYDKYNFVTHKWIKHSTAPKNIYSGYVLHYDLFDYKYLIEKFKQRSDHMLLVVFYFRYMLALVARDCTDEQVKQFYLKYIAITDKNKIEMLQQKKILLRIDEVSKFFNRI